MLKNTTKDQKGFTIIEVLIVLAIAGLILLIVFLAVPALQRNARNTAIKSDVQSTLGGVSDFAAANSGAAPQDITGTGIVTYKLTTGGTPTTIKIQGSTAVTSVSTVPVQATPVPLGTIQVVLKSTCSAATGGTGLTSARAVAAYYSIEATSGIILQCSDS